MASDEARVRAEALFTQLCAWDAMSGAAGEFVTKEIAKALDAHTADLRDEIERLKAEQEDERNARRRFVVDSVDEIALLKDQVAGQLRATEAVRETANGWERAYSDEFTTSTKLRADVESERTARLDAEGALAEYEGIEGRCAVGHNKRLTYLLEGRVGCVACERDAAETALAGVRAALRGALHDPMGDPWLVVSAARIALASSEPRP